MAEYSTSLRHLRDASVCEGFAILIVRTKMVTPHIFVQVIYQLLACISRDN